MKRWLGLILPPLLTALIVCAAAELAVARGWIADYLLPRPSSVWKAFFQPETDLWRGSPYANSVGGLAATAMNATIGFLLSCVCGIAVALLLSANRWIRQSFYPFAVFFQTVPIIALAPMMIIWLGYGAPTVRGAACIASIFPIIANTYAGIVSTDPALRDLFRLYGAGWFATTLKLRLPAALPSIFTGLRIAAGLAVIGAIVGEFITNGGLGEIILTSQTQQKTEKLFAAVILASLLGLGLVSAVNLLSWLTLRHWHASERE